MQEKPRPICKFGRFFLAIRMLFIMDDRKVLKDKDLQGF